MGYTVRYAVPMSCQDCVDSVKQALKDVPDVEKLDVDLPNQQITVTGDVPPSSVIDSLEGAGKDAIVRGSGQPNSAAVCILEDGDGKVHGLARLVESDHQTVFDVSVGTPGRWIASINSYGDLSRGAESAGPALRILGLLTPTKRGASLFAREPVSVSELIGRSMVVRPETPAPGRSAFVGVIARSAGLWENDKVVCSCTGQTLWQERAHAKASA